MTSRDNLEPTPTVDKNGRLTTVYKKKSGGSNPVITVPLPKPPVQRVDRYRMISSFVAHFETSNMSDEAHETMITSLGGYSDDLLGKLDEARVSLAPGFGLVGVSVSRGESENDVSEQLYFYREMEDMVYYSARHLVDSVHYYPQLPASVDYSKESDEVRAQCSALMMVSRASVNITKSGDEMFDRKKGEYVLKDKRLVDLVMAHSDEAAHLSDFIRSHRTLDVDRLREFLNTESKALGTGLL